MVGTSSKLVGAVVILLASSTARAGGHPAFYTSLPPPKVLLVGQGPEAETLAEQWRAATPAQVTSLQLFYDDMSFHHLCDKPLEERKEDRNTVLAAGAAYRRSILDRLGDFDVIVTDLPSSSPSTDRNAVLADVYARIRTRISAGGRLVIMGNPLPEPSMANVMPCRLTSHAVWTTGSEGATDHPIVRGLPFEVTGAHLYAPLCEAIDASSVPLTRSARQNRLWWRSLPGGGQSVYVPDLGGGNALWRLGTDDRHYAAERPDDGRVWDAFVGRLFYWLTYGDRAFPALVKIALPPGSRAEAGRELSVPVEVENRSATARAVAVSLNVSNRRWPQAASDTQSLTLAHGERRTLVLRVTANFPSTDDTLFLEAQVADTGGQRLAESLAFIPFRHAVPIAVTTPRASYGPGETIAVGVQDDAAKRLPGARVDVDLVDHRGRVVARADARNRLVMPDGGPELLSTYWVTAVVTKGGEVLGTARTQVQVDRRWDMRAQLQMSVWTDARPLRKVALMRDAGFNALGYPGNAAVADQLGLRQYVEGTGINTFGVTIDHPNWADVQADMERQLRPLEERDGVDARSKSLVSLGEESGFKNGWGTRYYWKDDRAPAVPQHVFDAYLAERYHGDIQALNAEWGTHHPSFADVALERQHARTPDKATIDPAAGGAAAAQSAQPYLAITAPDYDTYSFFDWYYEKYTQLAMKTYRQRRNPAPLSIMSAPGGFSPKVDVFNFAGISPFYPKEQGLVENAIGRRDYGDTPGFGLMWGYFDLLPLWRSVVLSKLLVGNTHLDDWVDVPLTFNPDLTHTRASFWRKLLARQLHPIQPILLHRRFANTPGLAMLVPPQPFPKGLHNAHFGSAIDPNVPIYSALEESGYMPKVVRPDQLAGMSVLIASAAQIVRADEGKAIARFVRTGGLLVATPWLGSCSPHGNMLATYPAAETGLRDLLGFRLRNTSQVLRREEVTVDGRKLVSKGRDQVLDLERDVRVLARYADGTPLMLQRSVGRGRIVYLNLIYDWDGWWNSFYESGREAYRRLIESVLAAWGRTRPDYFISVESAQDTGDNRGWWGTVMPSQPHPGDAVPWWASQLFSDPSGRIKYLTVFADHRSPRITAQVRWNDPHVAIVDLMTGALVPNKEGRAMLTLGPGEAAIWAISRRAPNTLNVQAPDHVIAGHPIALAIASPDSSGAVVDAYGPAGGAFPPYALSNVSLAGGHARIQIPTAENDPPGAYRLVVTDSITHRQATKVVTLTPGREVPPARALTPFPPRPSDDWAPATMTSSEFLRQLRLLRSIYQGTFSGLEAKYMLSYFLHVPFRPDNRHGVMRRLQRVDWTPHLVAVADALRDGETFFLTGEDLNVDPKSGVTIDPFAQADEEGFLSALARLPGATRTTRTTDGLAVETIALGKGAMVICRKASADRAAYVSADFAAWQARIKSVLRP